jgi:diaminobutyrate-2-oxoglutarate transaminase
LSDPESGIPKPAAVILEVIQGEGGCIPASVKWLRGVRELTAEMGILLIVDEVQTGLGRTGNMFAFQKAEIIPDILVLSKAVGGGYPLAVVIYREELDVWPKGMHAGTFRGTQIAMVAGRTTMGIIQRDRLDLRAGRMGELLASGLRQLSHKHPFFSDVRGRGLMIGTQIRCKGGHDRPGLDDGALAQRLKLAAFKRGLLVETGGRHGSVLRFLPPLILEEADVTAILERLESAAADVVKQGETHGR